MKTKLACGGFQELPDMSNNDSSLGTVLSENTKPILPILPPVIVGLLASWPTMIVRLLVFKTTVDMGKGRWT